jgi:predicted acylesterase/phospholipase RssA
MEYDLIFEGGGMKGNVFVGAMQEFFARGHSIRRLVGTSAGSITASLLAAGYKAEQLLEVISERTDDGKLRFATFMDSPSPDAFTQQDIDESIFGSLFKKADSHFSIADSLLHRIDNAAENALIKEMMKFSVFREVFLLLEKGGLYSGNEFLKWIIEKLNHPNPELGLGNSTFSKFYEITGKDLTVVASDITGEELLIINRTTAPDCPVCWGVRMSMSIPFVWQEVRWSKDWGLYRGKDISGHRIVDGGLLSNFPIELIASSDDGQIMEKMEPIAFLGLLIDTTISVDSLKDKPVAKADDNVNKSLGFLSRISLLIDTMLTASDNILSIEAHSKEVCHLPAKTYGTVEFDMNDERLNALINAGRRAMKEYFDSNS